ncbi:hypothetical protein FCR2A7T_15520 [Flavobacterium cauense R2A-7]|nr:hypothetical protein FCR2A7T_15520 [Flavobacterium cauense R2A-7]
MRVPKEKKVIVSALKTALYCNGVKVSVKIPNLMPTTL